MGVVCVTAVCVCGMLAAWGVRSWGAGGSAGQVGDDSDEIT